jgi:uncharacterized membrane protein
MSKIVAAIFADRAKAYEGGLALKHLAAKGVEVRASAIISKGSDSKLSVLEDSYGGFRVTAAAALIGGLAGLSGGPLGALMGAVGGALIGVSAELTENGEATKLVARISKELAPGSAAVVADIAEEGMSSFEKSMRAAGGTIQRKL